MKKVILFTNIVLCNITIFAQPIDCYEFLNSKIDSLTAKYSIHDFVDNVDFLYNDGFCFADLTEEQQNRIIDKVYAMFNQNEYIGLYDVASELLEKLYKYNNNNNVKKRMVEIWYDKICYFAYTIISFGNSQNYSEKAKQRLLDIMAKRWTKEDISAWKIIIEHSVRKKLTNDYKYDVQKIMKETNRKGKKVEKFLLDSLVQQGIEKNLQRNMNRPVSRSGILMIGSLKDERFIPYLESIIEETKTDKDSAEYKKACTYALAKLGVQKYIDEILENDKEIKYRYLGTKEAFLRWLELNRDWNKSDKLCSKCGYLPVPIVSLWDVQEYVKNEIPKELKIGGLEVEYFCLPDFPDWKKKYCDSTKIENSKLTIKKIDKLYQWLWDNKDKLILPPANDWF